MKIFLMFLIIKTNSFNGITNSYNQLENYSNIKNNTEEFYNRFFLLMKVKMKISYEACL